MYVSYVSNWFCTLRIVGILVIYMRSFTKEFLKFYLVLWISFQLHYLRLPKDIKDHYVMLMDATVATGAAAMMAIRVLLDHDVPEENILLLSLIMAESGNGHHRHVNLLYIKKTPKYISLVTYYGRIR